LEPLVLPRLNAGLKIKDPPNQGRVFYFVMYLEQSGGAQNQTYSFAMFCEDVEKGKCSSC
jgi:hypothetical protein